MKAPTIPGLLFSFRMGEINWKRNKTNSMLLQVQRLRHPILPLTLNLPPLCSYLLYFITIYTFSLFCLPIPSLPLSKLMVPFLNKDSYCYAFSRLPNYFSNRNRK